MYFLAEYYANQFSSSLRQKLEYNICHEEILGVLPDALGFRNIKIFAHLKLEEYIINALRCLLARITARKLQLL